MTRSSAPSESASARFLAATRRAEQRHFWFRGLRAFLRLLLAEATAGIDRPRLLDCGCGTGANLAVLDEFGAAIGFDIAPSGVAYARHDGRCAIVNASIAQIPFRAESFDVVTAIDVLYTLDEEAERDAVREIYRVLRPGGTAIINVAALGILRGNHAVFGGELRRSTRRRLRALLEGGGFTISRLTYSNASIFPFVLSVRLLQRLAGLTAPEEGATDIVVPPAPVNAALAGLLALEAKAMQYTNMPIGSSLLCAARRLA